MQRRSGAPSPTTAAIAPSDAAGAGAVLGPVAAIVPLPVAGTAEAHWTDVGDDDRSPARARRALRALLEGAAWPADAIEDACLVASELVTNARRHGDGVAFSVAQVAPDHVVVAVGDRAAQLPTGAVAVRDPGRAGGRGLHIVEAVSSCWGVVVPGPRPARKVVWCAVPCTAAVSDR